MTIICLTDSMTTVVGWLIFIFISLFFSDTVLLIFWFDYIGLACWVWSLVLTEPCYRKVQKYLILFEVLLRTGICLMFFKLICLSFCKDCCLGRIQIRIQLSKNVEKDLQYCNNIKTKTKTKFKKLVPDQQWYFNILAKYNPHSVPVPLKGIPTRSTNLKCALWKRVVTW